MPTLFHTEAGRGRPLVLLHGYPLDSRIWEAQVAGLSAHMRVITPDLRGFGKSPGVGPFSLETLADDVHELLLSIGALPCVVGGLSMGGYVTLAYAKKYAADLRGIVLVDTKATADDTEAKKARDQMIELVRGQGAKAIADKMEPKMLAPATLKERPDVVARLRAMMESIPARTIENALAAMRDRPDHVLTLAAITVPTLIIVGESDAITPPALAEQMKQKLAHAQLEVIADAGHMSPMEQPERVNDALRNFLKK